MIIKMANIKKIFIIIFFFTTFISSISFSEVVKKVEIKGNQRITLETVVMFADISVGKDYQASDLNLIIKKLYETTFFSQIDAEIIDGKLIINLKENPIINSVVFNGEKAKKFTEKLIELSTLRENGSFVENFVKNDINLIKTFYRNQGFYFVKIDAQIEKLSNNRVNISYQIDKGDKAKIAKIYFLGDKKIREKKLRDIITSQENTFWKIISTTVYLSKERIELDKRLLKNYYKNKGYYDVDIKSTNVEYSEGEGFVLTYNINAGKRYRFSKVYADVSETLETEAFLSLEKEFNKMVGGFYSQKKIKSVLDKIDELSTQRELQFINHNIVETLEGNNVEVKINIFEGEKVIIEKINIVGNSVTNDSVIRSELIVDEGDPFSELLVNKSINKIKGRRIFGKVEHKVLPGSTADLKVLEINVEERATGEIMAGAGIGTDGTSFQFAVTENNWLGRGIKLESALNLSAEKVSGNIFLINPNYKFSGNAVTAGVDVSTTDRASTSGYKSSRTGFELGTDFEQYENIFIAPSLTTSFEDIEADSTASKAIKAMEGNFFNVDLGYTINLDKRNQTFKPTKGYKSSFTQSLPLVQDSSSILNGINVSMYNDFTEDLIGSLKFYGRTINGIDDDVRLTNRLFIPANKLRGFNTYKVGPKDGDDYVGGNYTAAITAEAQLPNLLPESYRTDFSFFLDSANIWGIDYSSAVEDTNSVRASVGLSANIFTTIGPLSFTVAQDIAKSTNDETETFNFRLGTSF